jgi:hypothetical protein
MVNKMTAVMMVRMILQRNLTLKAHLREMIPKVRLMVTRKMMIKKMKTSHPKTTPSSSFNLILNQKRKK